MSETLADLNSYGFRPNRSTADAVSQCFKCLAQKRSAKWVLEGYIKACFDKIGHQWLMDNITVDKRMLEQWLKSGYVDKGLFYDTDEGTPQGGIISPTLMLMTLAGIEQQIKSTALKKGARANFIGYADDFVVTCSSKEVLVNDIKPLIAGFLAERGLSLSEEKTKITHIDDGFDFLGFNHRKYKGKLLIKPSKSNTLLFLRNLRKLIKKHATIPVNDLIKLINPKLRGGRITIAIVLLNKYSGMSATNYSKRYGTGQLDVIQPSLKTGLFISISSIVKASGNFTVGRKS